MRHHHTNVCHWKLKCLLSRNSTTYRRQLYRGTEEKQWVNLNLSIMFSNEKYFQKEF